MIAVTPGDPSGIGPEVLWKALLKHPQWSSRLLVIGAREPFERLGSRIHTYSSQTLSKKNSRPTINLLEAPRSNKSGLLLEGYQAGWSIQKAVELIQAGVCQSLVTGPIDKARLRQGGFKFNGHTDFLSELSGEVPVTMMLANPKLRVSLVTTHCSLVDVSKYITFKSVQETIERTYQYLRHWGIQKPKIDVLGLNPHAGEKGLFGQEEQRVISPVIRRIQKKLGNKIALAGPFSADGYFAERFGLRGKKNSSTDAVICMYHDQGLIPVKMINFKETINITLGLPFLRTSVDHGTAFDIVGKKTADPSSMIAALKFALKQENR
jgi:4-hydroxythreonine-4-phosphate dehydrogenase